ncbi:T9SS type A sorting domain-containing protein [Bacteroidales bacterium OttesenSCG-928-C19]|nr:T9SS type A sorting domain-containing protein [Bacteroidales bacterium OttesenSCG-928-C19]
MKTTFLHNFIASKKRYLLGLCLMLCFSMMGTKAFAISGNSFTEDNLISDFKWNQSLGRIEFKVLFYDTYGGSRDEWLKTADLYINNIHLASLSVFAELGFVPEIVNRSNLIITPVSSNSQRIKDHLFVYSYGVAATEYVYNSSSNLQEIQVSQTNRQGHTFGLTGNHVYAQFYFYLGEINSNYGSCTVELRNIEIEEQTTGDKKNLSNVSKFVNITVPSTPSMSITGGNIVNGGDYAGGLSFTCNASGASKFALLRNGTIVETKEVSNSATFTGKYLASDEGWWNYFENGYYFSFYAYKSVSGGKTVYRYGPSSSLYPQRTGVFEPSTINITEGTCGQINLSWTLRNPSTTTNVNTTGFELQVQKGTETGWTTISNSPLPGYNNTTTIHHTYSYTYQIPTDQLNKGEVNYRFRVKRAFANWDDDVLKAKNGTRYFQANGEKKINTNFKRLASATITSGTNNFPIIKWNISTVGLECPNEATLTLKVGNTSTNITDSLTKGSFQTSKSQGVETCTPQRYELILKYGSKAEYSYEVIENYIMEDSTKREFKSITASKGYYSDYVNIKWQLNSGTDDFDKFRLWKWPLGSSIADGEVLAEVTHTGLLQYSYNDNNVNAGIYYNYAVEGIYSCETKTGSLYSSEEIGFSQPFGSVSGRITYEGSQAVEGVHVNLITEDALRSNRELSFFTNRSNNYVKLPEHSKLFSREGFSFQAWIKLGNSTKGEFIFFNNFIAVWRDKNRLWVDARDFNKATNVYISDTSYVHLTVTVERLNDKNYNDYEVRLYVDGDKKETLSITRNNSAPAITTSSTLSYGNNTQDFIGTMDDIRIWDKVLTAEEIANNYDRVLSGKEDNLQAYYRCDETDVVNNWLFDCSAVGNTFNGRHATKYAGVAREDVPANATHLTLKGITNKNGIYQITNAIPFTSQGTLYEVVPMLGVHQFNPSSRPQYFTPKSSEFNNVDFTDISSFDVSGYVLYEGGTYPVAGAQFKVDGRVVVDSVGMPILSNDNGYFNIQVPIGEHEVVVEKSGHTFKDDGRLLSQGKPLNYNKNESDLRFWDQTRVKLIGHIVGGKREHKKPSGFGLRNNNIGVETFTLKAAKDFLFLGKGMTADSATTTFEHSSVNGPIEGEYTTLKVRGSDLTITVSPTTGEFSAWVYPERYTIGDIKVKGKDGNNIDVLENAGSRVLDLSESPVIDDRALQTSIRTWTDSVWMEPTKESPGYYKKTEYSDTIKFHKEWSHYYQAYPSYTITQMNGTEPLPYFGDKSITIKTTGKPEETVEVINANNEYLFGLPVFSQGKRYSFFLKAFEEYYNANTDKSDIMPVEDVSAVITTGIALKEEELQIAFDKKGEAVYEFIGGAPNLSDGKKSLSSLVNIEGRNYYPTNMPEVNGTMTAYLLGSKSTGTDFMTAASDQIDFILHDPPGSNSYAYVEEGATITNSHTFELAEGDNTEAELNTLLGTDQFILAGVGLLSGGETEVVHKVGLHEEFEYRAIDNKTYVHSTTFTENFSTSPSEDFVGHSGDIFIGTGTNLLYGWSNTLSIKRTGDFDESDILIEGDEYSVGFSKSMAFGTTLGTRFFFTEQEIENIQIPKWKSAIENILQFNEPDPTEELTEPFYFSKLGKSEENFGKPNSDPVFGAAAKKLAREGNMLEGPSYKVYYPAGHLDKLLKGMDPSDNSALGTINMTDTIALLNQKIIDWETLLARNEKNKVEAIMNGNISFGGGVTISKSESTVIDTTYESGYTISSTLTFQGETGFNVMGVGLEVKANSGWGHEEAEIHDSTNTSESIFGFVLEESGTNDEISVDYGRDPEFNTFVFKTRGGRTSCPYEGEVKTKYYEPGNHILSEATMQIEKPLIDVATGVYRTQVPSTRPAVFNLKLMNESETNTDGLFQLVVDESTNPDGAILKVDGVPIGNGRTFMIPGSRTVINKTLTIEKGPSVDSCNVRLILASACQYDLIKIGEDLFDFIDLTVYFIPSCTEAEILSPSNNWIVNTESDNSKMMIEIGNYDLNYANFGHLELQYRRSGSSNWNTIMTFFGDEGRYKTSAIDSLYKQVINSNSPTIQYEWDMSNISDATYEIRVRSVCETPSLTFISEYNSDALSGIKDMSRPESMGAPSPTNGIFTAADEISITFNEEIQSGRLTQNNFKISGIFNAEHISEPSTGLWFDGSTSAFTELPIYADGSFSIETWFKRNPGTAGTLFAYGESSNYISLGFDADGYVIVNIGGDNHKSSVAVNNSDETWKYIGLAYDRNAGTVSVYGLQGNQNLEMIKNKNSEKASATQGRLYIGNNAAGNNGFKGAVGLFHFYDKARSMAEMVASMRITKSGSEPNLIGLWEMSEGDGNMVTDKARARHLTLNTGWYIYPSGKSLAFNGTKYASVPSGTFPFRKYDDFTIEFWFNGAAQNTVNLLSIGSVTHIGFDANRNLILSYGENKHTLSNADLLNNEWHHFALSIKRNGMATAIIDGVVAASFSSNNIISGDVGGTYYTLGAHYAYTGTKDVYSQHFKGNIDELRVWNTALSTSAVKMYKMHKLNGDEHGLIAYYPFESWIRESNGVYSVYNETKNLVYELKNGEKVYRDSLAAGYVINNEAAAMIDARPEKTLGHETDYTFTASNNKIIFNILTDLYRIEGVTLTISAEGILDLRDNVSKPARWIAYVNRNPLNWLTEKVDIVMKQDEKRTFTAQISNAGGTSADYYIDNLPSWLEVNTPSGTLQPLQNKELTFTISNGINIGSYEASVALIGINDVQKVLPITLKVTGEKPDWNIIPEAFASSMSITGQITIKGIYQEDPDDLLAAFIGDLCVGVTSPTFISSGNAWFAFSDIYGDSIHNNQELTFKLWDASTGRIYSNIKPSIGTIHFAPLAIFGSISKPVIFDAQNTSEQVIALKQGWTWVSSNVLNNNPAILTQMKTSLGNKGVMIKGRDGYVQQPSWLGDLTEVSEKNMYLINTNAAHSLVLEGVPADPATTPITINKGWNWIGYIPQFNLPVKDALASINAKEGDLIKAQTGYATYMSGNWVGSLSSMQAGKGYMYYSESGKQTLTYPSQAVFSKTKSKKSEGTTKAPTSHWTVDDSRFSGTLTVTGIVVHDNEALTSDQIEIAAFCNNECRGSAIQKQLKEINDSTYAGFLTVYGEQGDEIKFKVYNHTTAKETAATNSPIKFTADAMYGTPANPYWIMTGKTVLGIDNVTLSQINLYPNPAKDMVTLSGLEQGDIVSIMDLMGRKIRTFEATGCETIFSVGEMTSGVYFVHINRGEIYKSLKLIVN